jgi:hypothetical protein
VMIPGLSAARQHAPAISSPPERRRSQRRI